MTSTSAQKLATDPRVAEAKRLLLETLAEHMRGITGIRPPKAELAESYATAIKQFGDVRAGPLYYPYLGSGLGKGALVELADGSVKYDFISGIGVHYLGHNHPALLGAGIDAALRDTVMQGNLQQNVESYELSQSILDLANRTEKRFTHCFLTTSGAMANENALKLAFQRHTPGTRVLAFEHAFAGRTLALAQITDKPAYRVGLPTTLAVDYVPFFDAARPKESIDDALTALREHLARHPKDYAVMCLELVQGEGGYYAGSREFFVAICDELRKANVAIWFDEIQTFGRTSQPFAFQHFDLDAYADVVTIGKLTQVCATLFTSTYKPQPGTLSQTFTASTSAIFAAKVILKVMKDEKFFGPDGKIQRLYDRFVSGLKSIAEKHPEHLSGPYGLGAMIACTVLGGKEAATKRFLVKLFEAGVISFVAGSDPARVRFLLPVGAVSEGDIDAVCNIIEQTLVQVMQMST